MDRIDLRAICTDAQTIGITGHTRPDGDCVASCLTLYQYLRKCFPDKHVRVILETPPQIFSQLDGFDQIERASQEGEHFDVFFVVDCEPSRIGEAKHSFEKADVTVNIDHHVSNPATSATLNYNQPQIGSCCEVIYDLLDPQLIDRTIAETIFVGMIHDTGVFQYSNTTPKTLEVAAHLIRCGIPFSQIIEESFNQRTYIQSQILGRTLLESVRLMNGRVAVGWVSQKTKDFYGVASGDLNGIVNQLRNIAGVDCAIFLNEIGLHEYKVSLRCTERLDATKVATYFGGGGHMRAAGCNMKGTLHDCVNNLTRVIEQHLSA
ncbi:MAG: bifunctional oligoribonuclease/PAP phosphatase NrnA [Clostridium sp.]|jgi:phosphoesterase RecJ-like protein|nr:bifunctional oligoribonuclease/PAP phosphatase NrnA [Clostridium sp.]